MILDTIKINRSHGHMDQKKYIDKNKSKKNPPKKPRNIITNRVQLSGSQNTRTHRRATDSTLRSTPTVIIRVFGAEIDQQKQKMEGIRN